MYSQFLALMHKGGPIMWIIFAAACIAMIMLIWQALRLISLTKSARNDYAGMRADRSFVPARGKGSSGSPITQLLQLMDWDEIESSEDMTKEMNIHLAEIMPRLEGGLPTVAIIGSLLPMLGLLGTVTGMINVFEVIAIHGSGKPDEMAHGISQALLTTASGLIIAIPVIFMHHLLSRRVDALVTITGQTMQLIQHRDFNAFKRAAKP
ncbi:MAG TPA: MotA/TolQ/ExbB proton channel family protein [Gammaproteobacteria bacterium]|nr:MotA/TolQ/ExbB proton channel family protein [Gammaproteobacteria bacterium]